ncbi:MAG: hypothetical protein ACE5LU_17190 [Anaerolineae bacterium]
MKSLWIRNTQYAIIVCQPREILNTLIIIFLIAHIVDQPLIGWDRVAGPPGLINEFNFVQKNFALFRILNPYVHPEAKHKNIPLSIVRIEKRFAQFRAQVYDAFNLWIGKRNFIPLFGSEYLWDFGFQFVRPNRNGLPAGGKLVCPGIS